MEQNQYVEYLLHFGLTRQEALIYVELLVRIENACQYKNAVHRKIL